MGSTNTTKAGNSRAYKEPAGNIKATMLPLKSTITPTRFCVMGDSTSNETDEWVYLTAQALAAAFPSHTHSHRFWNDTNQQYDAPSTLAIGPLGLRHIDTGAKSTSMRLEIDDSAATSITGDIDVRVKLDFHGNALTSSGDICGKMATAPNRSWRITTGSTSGKITFVWSTDGTTDITKSSSVVVPSAVYNNGPVWIRVTLDVDNGASGNDLKFYYGTDNANWTQIGTTVTTAGVTSIADTAAKTQFIGRGTAAIAQQPLDFSFYEMEVYGSLDGTNRVVDIDVGAMCLRDTDGVTVSTFYDDVGNLVNVTHHNNSSIIGSPRLAWFNGSKSGASTSYFYDATRYPKMITGNVNAVFINTGHNHTYNIATFITEYKTLTDLLQTTDPYMQIFCNLQNKRISPATYINEHTLRMVQLSKFAASQGFEIIDAFTDFPSNGIDTDGVHPVASGSAFWRDRVLDKLMG